MDPSSNRRRFMRHDDEVLLRLRRLDGTASRAVLENLAAWRLGYRLGDDLQTERQGLQPAFAGLRERMPEVAAYIVHLERRLDTLSMQIDAGPSAPASAPTARPTRVNLSAQGLRCETPERLDVDDAVEVGMALLPDYRLVAALGRVIRTEAGSDEGLSSVSINFDHILEPDRETLIRHVFRLQRESLALRKAA